MNIQAMLEQLDVDLLEQGVCPYSGDDVFINRIEEFEAKYKMRWYAFERRFDARQLCPKNDEERLDYAEWRMLCYRFSDALEMHLESIADPPLQNTYTEEKEGSRDRALLLC